MNCSIHATHKKHISRSTCINYGNYLNFFSLLLRSLITNHQRYVLKFVRCLRVWNCKIDAHAIEKFMNYLEKSKSWLASNALRSNERKKKNNTQARVLTRVGFAKKNIFGDCDTVIWGTNKQSLLIWFRSTFFLVRNFFRSDFVWYFSVVSYWQKGSKLEIVCCVMLCTRLRCSVYVLRSKPRCSCETFAFEFQTPGKICASRILFFRFSLVNVLQFRKLFI